MGRGEICFVLIFLLATPLHSLDSHSLYIAVSSASASFYFVSLIIMSLRCSATSSSTAQFIIFLFHLREYSSLFLRLTWNVSETWSESSDRIGQTAPNDLVKPVTWCSTSIFPHLMGVAVYLIATKRVYRTSSSLDGFLRSLGVRAVCGLNKLPGQNARTARITF